jgi:hypothetical protein
VWPASGAEFQAASGESAASRRGPSKKTDACFIVRDYARQALAYFYFERELASRCRAADLL